MSRFRIHKTDSPGFPWAMDYPPGFREDDCLGVACSSFPFAVDAFVKASERQCPMCLKGAVADRSWGWECTACRGYDVAVGCTRPSVATRSIFDVGPSKTCTECRSSYTGEHFCYGTYPA